MNNCKLTVEIKKQLSIGTKVKFKWRGNSELTYEGRIEVKDGVLYFCAEHNYKNEDMLRAMQYYNRLDSFSPLTQFQIIKN